MAYITNSDLEIRLGSATYVQLSDDDNDGVADTAVVDEVRLAAEGELDSYLAVRHAVPVDLLVHPELAGLLRSTALDLAEFRLRMRRPPVPDDARRLRDQTVAWLRRIAEGAIALPSLSVPQGKGIEARASGNSRLLSRKELESH